MKELFCNQVTLLLSEEGFNVRVWLDGDGYLILNHEMPAIAEIISNNFHVVYNYYLLIIREQPEKVSDEDLSKVSVTIVLRYICMYSLWNSMYAKRHNDLLFDVEDFNHPTTHDCLIFFFSKRYQNWKEICAVLLNKSLTKFDAYYSEREKYYNR